MQVLMNQVWMVVALLFVAGTAQGQNIKYRPDTSWKVYAYNAEKRLGFSGGFNNPQFGMGDLNADGKLDLVVFEKGSLQIKTFINYGSTGAPVYRYRPQYADNFPTANGTTAVSSYMKLEDLNCDKIPDLVTRGNAGFSVYYGYYQNKALHFRFYKELYYSPLTATPEGFEATAFPTNGWTVRNRSSIGWSRVSEGANPSVSPRQGSGMAMFNANGMPAGSTALLASRGFRLSPNLKIEGRVSFWIYRDNATAGDSLSVFINNTDSIDVRAVYLGSVARSRSINLPDVQTTDGWYQYTFPVPLTAVGNRMHFLFRGTSRGGNNIFLDDVQFVTSSPFGDVNAYVDPGGDIPGIADIDNDGDMDFFSFYIGGGYLSFYKNYQQEAGLPCDTIAINLKDACWGKFYQGFSPTQTLGVSCNSLQPIVPPAKTTHTGNTICLFDHDGDGDFDLLNGGVSYHNIQFLQNGKWDYAHNRDTIIAQDTAWQTNGFSYQTMQFPAAFHMDIDQDGAKDILISPSAEFASENYKSIAYYRNTGSATSPAFAYQHDTLLVSEAIDLGTGAYPMLYDFDKDGKLDLLVGSDGYFQPDGSFKAQLALYRNSSDESGGSYTLLDNNFLDVQARGIKGAYPAAGDVDNDGLDDLLLGHADGSLSFYKNVATSANSQPQWQLSSTSISDIDGRAIDSSKFAAPFLYDIDKDGKKDLLIGGQHGRIFLYRNVGGSGQFALQYQTGNLGGVRADPWNFLIGYSTPFVGITDSTGIEYLVVGSNSGRIARYTGFQDGNTTGRCQLVDTAYHEINTLLGAYSGFRAVPAFGDLDGDGQMEMLLGNVLGGVVLYEQQEVKDLPPTPSSSFSVKMFPNPTSGKVYFEWDADAIGDADVDVSVANIAGQILLQQRFPAQAVRPSIDISGWAAGMYICAVSDGGQRFVGKLVLIP